MKATRPTNRINRHFRTSPRRADQWLRAAKNRMARAGVAVSNGSGLFCDDGRGVATVHSRECLANCYSHPAHELHTTFEFISARARRALAKYGHAACRRAYQANREHGEGARSIAQQGMAGDTINTTRQADAAIDAWDEVVAANSI